MRHSISITAILTLTLNLAFSETPSFSEGEITLCIKQGKRETTLRYLKKDEQLRIERPGEHVPSHPINLIDLEKGTTSIIHPHNGTWIKIPAERFKKHKTSDFPPPPMQTGIGAKHVSPGTAVDMKSLPSISPPASSHQTPFGIGPQPESGTPAARVPAIDLPQGAKPPQGIGPNFRTRPPDTQAGPSENMPSIPAMTHGLDADMNLVPGKETRQLHGYSCQKYTLIIPREGEMTLWLSDAKDLPPYYELIDEAPRKRGRTEWKQQWQALLRERRLFPMLAVLRTQPDENNTEGHELMRWEISSITPTTIEDKEGSLFEVPPDFHQIELPSL